MFYQNNIVLLGNPDVVVVQIAMHPTMIIHLDVVVVERNDNKTNMMSITIASLNKYLIILFCTRENQNK